MRERLVNGELVSDLADDLVRVDLGHDILNGSLELWTRMMTASLTSGCLAAMNLAEFASAVPFFIASSTSSVSYSSGIAPCSSSECMS